MKLLLFIFSVLVLFAKESSAQTADNRETNQFHIHKISDKITLDGIVDEPVWQTIAPATDFWEQWPDDQKKALLNTEVRLPFNDQFLYISAVLKENPAYKHIIPTLKRDAPNFFEGDNFIVVLDPVNERSSGFIFGVNAGGAQMEGMLGAFEPDWSWDNKWYVETKNNTDNWTIEMAIPFKSLRFVAKKGQWGINFVRSDLKSNKYYSWARVPVQFRTIDIGYTGALVWDDLPPAVKDNISIIPYLSSGLEITRDEGATFSTVLSSTGNDGSQSLDLSAQPIGMARLVVRSIGNVFFAVSPKFRLTTACGPADFNGDETMDFFDYLDFVAAFSAGDPAADFNLDGTIDFFDYLDFVAAFSSGGC